jgi:membrane protein YqaA with SNARE-associated domain
LSYLVVFLGALAVDLIPVVAPPAWTLMAFMLVKYDLNPWVVLAVGVPGSALGRYLFSLYIPKFSDRMIARRKNEELRYVGKKLERHWWQTSLFVFGYTLLPLSTTALFTAAAMTKVPMLRIIPAFMAGKFLSDAMMVAAGRYAADAIADPLQGMFGWKSLTTAAVTVLITAAFLFVDWHALVAKKKFRLNFSVWK